MMLDYSDITRRSVTSGKLHDYCKDENLDYLYTVAAGREKREKAGKGRAFLKRIFRKRCDEAIRRESCRPENCM